MNNHYPKLLSGKNYTFVFYAAFFALVFSSCTVNIGQSKKSSNVTSQTQDDTDGLKGSPDQSQLPTLSDHGNAYLRIVNPVNCLMREIALMEEQNMVAEQRVDPQFFGELQRLFALLTEARSVASDELWKRDWPLSIKVDVETMANSWASLSHMERDIARANTIDEYNIAYFAWMNNEFPSNPQFIRTQLGVGASEVTDRC